MAISSRPPRPITVNSVKADRCEPRATNGTAPAGGCVTLSINMPGDGEANGNGCRPPKAWKQRHGEAADQRCQQIAAEHVGRLRQRTFGLAENQHSRCAEGRDQQRNAGCDRQSADGNHTRDGAGTGLQMSVPMAFRFMAMNEVLEMAMHGRSWKLN